MILEKEFVEGSWILSGYEWKWYEQECYAWNYEYELEFAEVSECRFRVEMLQIFDDLIWYSKFYIGFGMA